MFNLAGQLKRHTPVGKLSKKKSHKAFENSSQFLEAVGGEKGNKRSLRKQKKELARLKKLEKKKQKKDVAATRKKQKKERGGGIALLRSKGKGSDGGTTTGTESDGATTSGGGASSSPLSTENEFTSAAEFSPTDTEETESRALGSEEEDVDEEMEEFEEDDMGVVAAQSKNYYPGASEDVLKKVFEYTAKCIYCPIHYDADYVNMFMKDSFSLLKTSLDVEQANLKGEQSRAKRTGKLILSELLQRKQSLGNHPFYHKNSFQTKDDFEEWKQREEKRLDRLIARLQTVPPFSGYLNVEVLGAKDLVLKKETTQPCDPYCVLTLGKTSFQTKVIPKTKFPHWRQQFTFPLSSNQDLEETLIIQVYEKKMFGNDCLGVAHLPLSETLKGHKQDGLKQWFTLEPRENRKDNVTGSINLSLQLHSRVGPEPLQQDSKGDTRDGIGYSGSYGGSGIDHHKLYEALYYYMVHEDRTRSALSSLGSLVVTLEDGSNGGSSNGNGNGNGNGQDSSTFASEVKERRVALQKEKPSAHIQWLLREYRERYGIGDYFDKIITLEFLISPFKLTTPRLDYLQEILLELKIFHATEVSGVSASELKLEDNAKNDLKRRLLALLNDYNRVFVPPKTSKGALGTVISLLALLSEEQVDINPVLEDCVQTAIRRTYRRFKYQARGSPLERQLCVASGFVPAAIETDAVYFADEFPKELSLVKFLSDEYYRLISSDVNNYYQAHDKVSSFTFYLYFVLRDLHELLNLEGLKPLNLTLIFRKFIDQWLVNFINKSKKWNKESIATDKWEPLDESESDLVLHSSSVVDVFIALEEVTNFYHRLRELRTSQHTLSFASSIAAVVRDYVSRVKMVCFEDINSDAQAFDDSFDFSVYVELSKKQKKKLESSRKGNTLIVKPQLCVRINNIHNTFHALRELAEKADTKAQDQQQEEEGEAGENVSCFSELLQPTMEWIIKSEQDIVDGLITKMNNYIQFALRLAVQPTTPRMRSSEDESSRSMSDLEKRLEPLVAYLNTQLIMLANHLYGPVFDRLMLGVWVLLLVDLEAMLLPPVDEVLTEKDGKSSEFFGSNGGTSSFVVELLPSMLDALSTFFYSEGKGLPMHEIESKKKNLLRSMELVKESTTNLIKLYNKLEKRRTRQANGGDDEATGEDKNSPSAATQLELGVLSILAQRKNDKEALRFVQQKKGGAQDAIVRNHFALPSQEVVLDKFYCCNWKMSGGWMYVTTSFVCFDTTLFGDHRKVLKLEDIREIKKKRFAKVIDNALKLVMKTGKKHFFSGFRRRNAAHKLITQQAAKAGSLLSLDSSTNTLTGDESPRSERGPRLKVSAALAPRSASTNCIPPLPVSTSESSPLSLSSTTNGGFLAPLSPRSAAAKPKFRGSAIIAPSVAKRGHVRGRSLTGAPEETAELSKGSDKSLTAANKRTSQLRAGRTLASSASMAELPDRSGTKRSSLSLAKTEKEDSAKSGDESSSSQSSFSSQLSTTDGPEPTTEEESDFTSTDDDGEQGQSKEQRAKSKKEKDEKESAAKDKRKKKHKKSGDKSANGTKEKKKKKLTKEAKAAEGKQKVQDKLTKDSEKLHKRFELESSIQFVDKFKCGYSSSKGNMYITTACVCFYASFLGGETKLLLPYSQIKKIEQKKSNGFVIAAGKGSYSFSRFSSSQVSDEAHALIQKYWKRNK